MSIEAIAKHTRNLMIKFICFSLSLSLKNEDYDVAQTKKDKMELYRTETYKQLQTLNLLDLVLVSRSQNSK